MKWNELYSSDRMPSFGDIGHYIGKTELWQELTSYLEKSYLITPKLTYSKCAGQPGWNVKYQKSSKSLCTLYPMEGFFIALVVIGAKEETEAELAKEMLTPYVNGLYSNTSFSCGGRWLMIEVKDKAVLDDVKRLIAIRVKPKIAV